jgi:hypothetical protein
LRSAELKFDENYCNVTTKHVERPGEIYKLGYNFELLVEVRTFFVKIGIALPSANGKFDSFIQNSVSDVCKYFKNNNNNLMLRMFFNGHFGTKNFPNSCPVKPGVYYIEDFRIKDDMLKFRSTETKFMVTVDFCTKFNEKGKLYCFLMNKYYGEVIDGTKWEKELEMRRQSAH